MTKRACRLTPRLRDRETVPSLSLSLSVSLASSDSLDPLSRNRCPGGDKTRNQTRKGPRMRIEARAARLCASIPIYRSTCVDDKSRMRHCTSMLKGSSRDRHEASGYLIPLPFFRRKRLDSRMRCLRKKTRIGEPIGSRDSRYRYAIDLRISSAFPVYRSILEGHVGCGEFSNARISTLFQNYRRSKGMKGTRRGGPERDCGTGRGPRRSRGFRRTERTG